LHGVSSGKKQLAAAEHIADSVDPGNECLTRALPATQIVLVLVYEHDIQN